MRSLETRQGSPAPGSEPFIAKAYVLYYVYICIHVCIYINRESVYIYVYMYVYRVLDRAPKEVHSLTPRARTAHRRHRLTRAIAELAPARAKKTLGCQS